MAQLGRDNEPKRDTGRAALQARAQALTTLSRFASDRRGGVGVMLGIFAPILILLVAGAISYGNTTRTRGKLQAAADSAALAAAREFAIPNADPRTIASLAQAYALSNLGASTTAKARASTSMPPDSVQVQIDQDVPSIIGPVFPPVHLSVKAQARLVGGTANCLLGLDYSMASTVALDAASLRAPGCSVYSNAQLAAGLVETGAATMTALSICSAGGYSGPASGYTPAPGVDCPRLKDPLADRPAPSVGPCTATNEVINGGSATLAPGVYCGGLKITGGAFVTLRPGVYVLKDGPLTIDAASRLVANNAGFYLTGANAVLVIDDTTTIRMQAPKSGPLAGILFFEDREAPAGLSHLMGSRNAPELLGTFYLPRNTLVVGYTPTTAGTAIANCMLMPAFAGQCPPTNVSVSAKSAWTIVIARQILVNSGVELVLNSNYANSPVAPPHEIVLPAPHLVN